jgi:hypothetical protein
VTPMPRKRFLPPGRGTLIGVLLVFLISMLLA